MDLARVLLLLAAAAAAASGAVEPVACPSCDATSGCLSHPPALLQTRHALERIDEGPAPPSVPALVPAFVAPPGAAATAAGKKAPKGGAAPGPLGVLSAETHSERAWEGYLLLKELRARGFTCPGGKYFPPNSQELQFDCRLWKAAQLHSQDMGMRGYFSHVSPEGTDPFDRSAVYGLPTFSENIAAGVSTASGTLEQWQNSDGHCVNMMDQGHNRMAVGYAYEGSSTYKHYWTQLFGSDSGAVSKSCYISGGADPVRATTTTTTTVRSGGSAGGGGGDGNSGGGGSGSDGGSCLDQDDTCPYWSSLGYCAAGHTYAPFMSQTCAQSCGCGGGSGPSPCADDHKDCSHWAGVGFCEQGHTYAAYMSETCKKSCGVCS